MNDTTLRAIEKAKEASDGGRSVLLFMQLACIVIFMAAWHEYPGGWTDSRLRTAQAAVWALDCDSVSHTEFTPPKGKIAEPENIIHDECHTLAEEAVTNQQLPQREGDSTISDGSPFTKDEENRARQFIVNKKYSPSQARKYLEDLENSFVDRTVIVSVPFLGITLDVNDLGLLGACAFALFLTWLGLTIRREAENVALLFEQASDSDIGEIYRLLSMAQVFSIPPKKMDGANWLRRWSRAFSRWLWKLPDYLLLLAPFGVESFVVYIDRKTFIKGWTVDPHGATVEYAWEIGFLCMLTVLTIVCVHGSVRVNKQWNEASKRIESLNRRKESQANLFANFYWTV